MNKFFEILGEVSFLFIVSSMIFFILNKVEYAIRRIKTSKNVIVIPKGTVLFNHDKGIKFKLKKDIEIKFKKDKSIKANTVDYSFGCISWGMNKEHAQSKLEDQLVDMVYEYYKDDRLGCKLMEEYIEDVRELN